jgi:hypothetical protein
VVAVLLFVGAPLAGAVTGWWAYDDARARAVAERAGRHQVPAVLLADAPAGVPSAQSGRQPLYRVAVRWTDPDAGKRTGQALVPAGSHRGDRTRVWLDAHGRGVDPPASDAAVWQHALTTGVWVTGGAVAVVLMGNLSVRKVGERHRLAEWEREWERTEPEWRNRTA